MEFFREGKMLGKSGESKLGRVPSNQRADDATPQREKQRFKGLQADQEPARGPNDGDGFASGPSSPLAVSRRR